MLKPLLFILFICPLGCLAQYVVTGKVLNANDKTPIAKASVFLNNAVVGTTTDDKGTFTLTNARPGQYDLVASCVGYEQSHQSIFINGNISLPPIILAPKIMMLKEVKIRTKDDWARLFEKFKKYFFGKSNYASQCKILNADLLDMDYSSKTRIFTASSSDFLIVENKALGYRIKYLLTELNTNEITGISYREGSARFEDLKGTDLQQRRWQKNRLEAFEGSSMQFLRTTINGSYEKEGFMVFKLIRKPNPDYRGGFDGKYLQTLVNIPLGINEFIKLTDIKGQFAFGYPDCLYILFDKKRQFRGHRFNKPLVDIPDVDDPTVAIVAFTEPYAYYDDNGVIINSRSAVLDGSWGRKLIADLLPVDYTPEVDNTPKVPETPKIRINEQ
ncbi:MAG: carboxypeptidase-like regulatory domain-containing protein [Mucilaginibacter sp.]